MKKYIKLNMIILFCSFIGFSSIFASNKDNFDLFFASGIGNTSLVKELLDKGVNPSEQNSLGITALMLASQNGHFEVVQTFLAKEADHSLQMFNGWTALMLASQNGHVNIVRILLEKGADGLLQNDVGMTALMIASQLGHIDVVAIFLEIRPNDYLVLDKDVGSPFISGFSSVEKGGEQNVFLEKKINFSIRNSIFEFSERKKFNSKKNLLNRCANSIMNKKWFLPNNVENKLKISNSLSFGKLKI